MHIETERKFLIRRPPESVLEAMPDCRVCHITQTYLMINGVTGEEKRIRRIVEGERETFVFTEKKRITDVSRTENEYGITAEEYARLYSSPDARELSKTRYAFPYEDHTVEIDIYPHEIGGDALDGYAVLEVELGDEAEKFALPPFIEVVRELTGTSDFSNKKMAKPRKKLI